MKKQKKQPKKITAYTGVLDISRSGIGFVTIENYDQDILIKPNDLGKAFNGDTVKIEITKHSSAGRSEGKVIDIVSRSEKNYVGILEINKNVAFFVSSNQSLPDFYIPIEKIKSAKNGDRVLAKFVKWDKSDKKPQGEIVEVINFKNASDLAMKEIILEEGFPLKFEEDVLQEAHKLNGRISREESKKRKDFRDILTFTIDPDDAKDFDDAISIRNMDNGYYEIGVHIADVSHFVTPGSILDNAAYERATSVYLPDRVNPMLPEKISNELCSLRPNEEKYTFSAVFQITNRAEIKHTWIGRTITCSDHRFTYDEVQKTIETGDGIHNKAILLLNNLAQQFRAERFKNGAINFSSQEVKFKLDKNGKPIDIIVKESKEAHKLIEEFMLLANRAVAEYVSKIKINKAAIPFPYRVHDKPDEDKLIQFAAFASRFGYKVDIKNPDNIADSFNKLLKDIEGKPEQHVLEQIGIRTMAKAKYTTENIGHYGLGFENYCHFTSPIRRYPDVMAHRILQQCIDKNVKVDKEMDEKCNHCSAKEKDAQNAERAGNKYKQVEFMSDYIDDEFDGVISGVSNFGFWVETVKYKCEGLVSTSSLADYDDFRFDADSFSLTGMRHGKVFRLGDKTKIKVVSANLIKRQLDYEWVSDVKLPVKKVAKKAPKKSTNKSAKK